MASKKRKDRLYLLQNELSSIPKDIIIKPSIISSSTRKRRLSNPSSDTLNKRAKSIRRSESTLVSHTWC